MKKAFIEKAYKIYAITLFAVFFVRYMLGGNLIEGTICKDMSDPASSLLGMIMIWFVILAIIVFIFNAFYDLKILRALTYFYSLPFAVINLIFINNTLEYMVGEALGARGVLVIIEAILLLIGTVLYAVTHRPPIINLKYAGVMAISVIVMLIYTMPYYTPLFFFGIGKFYKKIDFSFFHRVYLYIAFIVPLIAYFLYKNKDHKFKEYVILFIGVSTLITFLNNYLFPDYSNLRSLPLHLCHTAMYIVPICIIFKLKKFFYFTYFVNVFGAFVAMLFPITV